MSAVSLPSLASVAGDAPGFSTTCSGGQKMNRMNSSPSQSQNLFRRRHWILAAALAAVPGFGLAGQVFAQAQQSTSGRALDANNRIGSGGTNTFRPAPSVGVYGNQVITGNV